MIKAHFARSYLFRILCNRTFTVAVPHFLHSFNVHLFVPLPYFIRSRFINFSTHRSKFLHTKGRLSFAGKNGPLYCHLFSSISSVSMFISLPFGTSLMFLVGLLSAIHITVAFCRLATKSSFYFACFYFAVFLCHNFRLAAILFAAWIAMPFLVSLSHFLF